MIHVVAFVYPPAMPIYGLYDAPNDKTLQFKPAEHIMVTLKVEQTSNEGETTQLSHNCKDRNKSPSTGGKSSIHAYKS